VQAGRLRDVFNSVTLNVFIAEKAVAIDVQFISVVICAYYVHSIYLAYDEKGFGAEFSARALLLLFLYTCYSLR
jgi:hypothetical protein